MFTTVALLEQLFNMPSSAEGKALRFPSKCALLRPNVLDPD